MFINNNLGADLKLIFKKYWYKKYFYIKVIIFYNKVVKIAKFTFRIKRIF